MHDAAMEKARELGRLIGQTDEYQALKRARERAGNDRETVELLNRLSQLEAEVGRSLQQGVEPGQEVQDEYESTVERLQQSSVYQGLAAAQANLEKILSRVNEEIGKGMEAGSQSRIILSK